MGTGAFAEGPTQGNDYRRGYLCGLIRGDGHLGSYHYERRGRRDDLHVFRLALCDPEALLRAQDYLLDFEVATGEFAFQAGSASRRPMHAIRANSFSTVETIRRMVARNEGVSFLPKMCVEQEVEKGLLCEVRIEELNVERKVHLVTPKRRALSHAARAFLEVVKSPE